MNRRTFVRNSIVGGVGLASAGVSASTKRVMGKDDEYFRVYGRAAGIRT